MKFAITFPGQGSQSVGMGKNFADSFQEAKLVFQEVDDALGEKLSTIIWEGPEDELTRTANAQPALMAVSIAVIRVLKSAGISVESTAAFAAGHSLGEYSALAALGCLNVGDTAKLLRIRGNAMQEAVPFGEGAMAALIGLDFAEASLVAEEAAGSDVCQVANDNAPGQVVVSGNKASVLRAMEIAKGKGAKRSILLPVSAPFHCRLMSPAQKVMEEALESVQFSDASVPLICNIDALPVDNVAKIKEVLIKQVTGTVRWRESVLFMEKSGVSNVYEIGAGKVLTGLIRRISPDVKGFAINTPGDVDELLTQFA